MSKAADATTAAAAATEGDNDESEADEFECPNCKLHFTDPVAMLTHNEG